MLDIIDRPLFKHIRNHDALFSKLAEARHAAVAQLTHQNVEYHKTPKLIAENGRRLSIEPERSIVLRDYQAAAGLKNILSKEIEGFTLVEGSDIGFRYPTAALADSDAPFIKRFRSEYFHRTDETRDICRPVNLSIGIKSRGKADNRQEYEVWVPEEVIKLDPLPLFIDKYAEDLPDPIRAFAAEKMLVHGWMGVKRCAFEGLYQNKAAFGDIIVSLSLSLDAYNIGARPDLSYSQYTESSIAYGGAEIEWEVMGYFSPKQANYSDAHIWKAINHTIEAFSPPLELALKQDIIQSSESKTERILSAVSNQGVTKEEIDQLNLQPWEFLQTESEYRKKQGGSKRGSKRCNNRGINLLGRLNRLFYHPDKPLPSLLELHELIAKDML